MNCIFRVNLRTSLFGVRTASTRSLCVRIVLEINNGSFSKSSSQIIIKGIKKETVIAKFSLREFRKTQRKQITVRHHRFNSFTEVRVGITIIVNLAALENSVQLERGRVLKCEAMAHVLLPHQTINVGVCLSCFRVKGRNRLLASLYILLLIFFHLSGTTTAIFLFLCREV